MIHEITRNETHKVRGDCFVLFRGCPWIISILSSNLVCSDMSEAACAGVLSQRRAFERACGECVKCAADAVDVDEWESARVRAVGEQDEDALARGVDPATSAGEAEMAEAVRRERIAGSRVGRGGQLPRERARLVKSLSHVRAEKLAGFGA